MHESLHKILPASVRLMEGIHTEDESPQVGLQGLKLVGVVFLLFLCDPPGVVIRVLHHTLLIQPLHGGGLGKCTEM